MPIEIFDSSSKGSVGKHDWCVEEKTEDGFLVLVDDRPVSFRDSLQNAKVYALQLIARLIADGDYRLNDRPSGFFPPALIE